MKNTTLLKKINLFILILVGITVLKQLTVSYFINIQKLSYSLHLLTKTGYNIVLALISFYMIKANGLTDLAGLSKVKTKKIGLVLIGGLYLIVLNILFADDISNYTITNIGVLLIYCVSIGFAEELSIRGFLQSSLINYFKTPKKAIVIASLIFGVLHLIKFSKGIYGELSQVLFATFIGVMFGTLLIITKRIYPLIIAHALIDFFAGIDSLGNDFTASGIPSTSLTNAIASVLLVSPCLFFGLYLMKKHIKKSKASSLMENK